MRTNRCEPRSRRRPGWVFLWSASLLTVVGCQREERIPRVQPPHARASEGLILTDLHAGSWALDDLPREGADTGPPPVRNPYEGNAFALAEGKRLYSYFNCVGCHSHGGGGMGPPFLDDQWIYGERPEQVFASIVQGRPNGMPSYRRRIPDYQVWQIVAYVRSLGGLTDSAAAPGRGDNLKGVPSPHSLPQQD